MYSEINSDLVLFGIYVFCGIIAMCDEEGIIRGLGIFIFLGSIAMSFVLLHERYSVLHREPVISSCTLIQDSDGSRYILVDSTLRCFGGYNTPFYTVKKKVQQIIPNDTTHCMHCGAIMRQHFDVSDHTTPEERETRIQQRIDYLTAPL